MYFIYSHKYINRGKMLDKLELLALDGFSMGSDNRIFQINKTPIKSNMNIP